MMMPEKNLIFSLVETKKIELIETVLPEYPLKEYVRISMEYCGICGTDLSFYLGHRIEEYPICLGHEHCGTVLSVGEDVKAIKKGDFVAIDPNYRCGACEYCKMKQGHLCIEFSKQLYSNRGYAEYIDIHESYAHVLPDFKFRHLGALVEPLSVAINAIEIADLESVKEPNILILGVGALGGLLSFAILSLFENIKITVYDKVFSKMQSLKAIYGDRITIIEDVNQHTSSFNYIFEVTGHSSGFDTACKLLSKKGNLLILSRYHGCEPSIPDRLPWKAPVIRFVHLNGNGESMPQAIDLLMNHWQAEHNNLLDFYNFKDIAAAFSGYADNHNIKKIIKFGDQVSSQVER